MKKVVYYSEPIGKEKIVLILETYKEEEKQNKEKIENKFHIRNTGNFISVYDEGRNCIVDMTDPYWQYYFKTN